MHQGQKLGENCGRLLGQRFEAGYHASHPKRIVSCSSLHRGQSSEMGKEGQCMCPGPSVWLSWALSSYTLTSLTPAYHVQLGHYARLAIVHPSYSPFLHLFKRSRSVKGLIPDQILRPALYSMPSYGQTGDADIDGRSPLYACAKRMVGEDPGERKARGASTTLTLACTISVSAGSTRSALSSYLCTTRLIKSI
jgi:hypothetical protein